MSELKPCPFCGAPGMYLLNFDSVIGCSDMRCRAWWSAMTPEQWNRRAPDWQPIATAPRDGTMILLWTDRGHAVGFYSLGFNNTPQWLDPDFYGKEPAHWMPLPEGPGEE